MLKGSSLTYHNPHHIGLDQITKCYAAREVMSKRTEKENGHLYIIMDFDKNKERLNPGLLTTMLRILEPVSYTHLTLPTKA